MESEVEQLPQAPNATNIDIGQPLPLLGMGPDEALPQFPKRSALPFRRTICRQELRQIVPPSRKRRSTKWSATASSRAAST